MISRELAARIRYIQIYTSKAVNDILAGEYGSVFKGRGMEFDEVRAYQPGDDVRTIDWNVTARTGQPYVKRYVEERELTVIFLVDLSSSGAFASAGGFKNEIAAEFCALVAFSAIKNNDKVGLVLFTDRVEMFIPPAKGVPHVLRLIRELLTFEPGRRSPAGTDISGGLDFLGRVLHKRGVVFLVSDFLDQGYEKQCMIMARRHDLIAVSVADPREYFLPDSGLVQLEDAETGELHLIDTSNPEIRRRYEQLARRHHDDLAGLFGSAGIDHIALDTGRDYLYDLIRFFRGRMRRSRY